MQRACDIGKRRKLDPVLRRYTFGFGSVFCLAGLVGGFYAGFGVVSHESAIAAPILEKIFLTTFIALACAAAGLIIGAAIGSTIYRFREKSKDG